ncbi:MAG: hypothetical protein HY075_04615 [Deltaproteobacteria bacterium]|nr:hypothetical protein [Deltaproteobacteria bacterium]
MFGFGRINRRRGIGSGLLSLGALYAWRNRESIRSWIGNRKTGVSGHMAGSTDQAGVASGSSRASDDFSV